MNKQIQVRELFEEDFIKQWINDLFEVDVKTLYSNYISIVAKANENSKTILSIASAYRPETALGLGNDVAPLNINEYLKSTSSGIYSLEIIREEIELKEAITEVITKLEGCFNTNFAKDLLIKVVQKQIKILFDRRAIDNLFIASEKKRGNNLEKIHVLRYEVWIEIIKIIRFTLKLVEEKIFNDIKSILNCYIQYDSIFWNLSDMEEQKIIRKDKTNYINKCFIKNSLKDFKGWSEDEIDALYQLKHNYNYLLDTINEYKKHVQSNNQKELLEMKKRYITEDNDIFKSLDLLNEQNELKSKPSYDIALKFLYASEPWIKIKYPNTQSLINAFTKLPTQNEEWDFVDKIELLDNRLKEAPESRSLSGILGSIEDILKIIPSERQEVFDLLVKKIKKKENYDNLRVLLNQLKLDDIYFSHNPKICLLKQIWYCFLINFKDTPKGIAEQKEQINYLIQQLASII